MRLTTCVVVVLLLVVVSMRSNSAAGVERVSNNRRPSATRTGAKWVGIAMQYHPAYIEGGSHKFPNAKITNNRCTYYTSRVC